MSIEKVKDILKRVAKHYDSQELITHKEIGVMCQEALAELEAVESKPEPCVGSDLLRKIAEETWPESCGPKRHLLTMADEFDCLVRYCDRKSESKPNLPKSNLPAYIRAVRGKTQSKPEPGEFDSLPADFKARTEAQHPLSLENDNDARYVWPKRWKRACETIESQAKQLKEYCCRYAESVRKSVEIAGERRMLKEQLAAKDKEIERLQGILKDKCTISKEDGDFLKGLSSKNIDLNVKIKQLTDCLLTLKDTCGKEEIELIDKALKDV